MSRLRRRLSRAKAQRNSFEDPQIVEQLERKTLLVGQVQALVRGNNLILKGENSSNQVEVAFFQGDVVVRPKQGTRINGVRGRFVAFQNTDTVPGSIYVNMRKGDDTVILSRGLKVGKDVYVTGQEGNDTLALDNAIIRDDLIFLGGAGNDSLSVEDSRVVDKTIARLSLGDDLIRVVNSEMRDDFRVHGHNGNDSMVLDGARIEGTAHFKLHSGDDAISMRNSRVLGRVQIKTRQDNDSVLLDDNSFERTVRIGLSSGNDELALGDGDGSDTTFASGNVFKKGLVAIGGRGTDLTEIDIDNEFRSVRNTESFETDGGFDTTPTDDAVTASDDLQETIEDLIGIAFTAGIDTDLDTVVRSASGEDRIFVTSDDTINISGVANPSTDFEIDADGDGVFDDATVTTESDGTYSVDVPLVPGQQTVDIRNSDQTDESQQFEVHRATGTVVRMSSNFGDIDIELLDDDAPVTVANFQNYFERYTDSVIHRAPDDFVIQGGGFTVSGSTVSSVNTDAPIANEFNADNSNVRGTLSMALLGGQPESGTSGWFINLQDNSTNLDAAQHTVFGRVIGGEDGPGMEIADEIDALDKFDIGLTSPNAETPLQNFEEDEQIQGTVAMELNSSTVTGTGTRFNQDLEVGDELQISDQTFTVTAINSNTELTVDDTADEAYANEFGTTQADPVRSNFAVFSDIGVLLENL